MLPVTTYNIQVVYSNCIPCCCRFTSTLLSLTPLIYCCKRIPFASYLLHLEIAGNCCDTRTTNGPATDTSIVGSGTEKLTLWWVWLGNLPPTLASLRFSLSSFSWSSLVLATLLASLLCSSGLPCCSASALFCWTSSAVKTFSEYVVFKKISFSFCSCTRWPQLLQMLYAFLKDSKFYVY